MKIGVAPTFRGLHEAMGHGVSIKMMERNEELQR